MSSIKEVRAAHRGASLLRYAGQIWGFVTCGVTERSDAILLQVEGLTMDLCGVGKEARRENLLERSQDERYCITYTNY